MNQTGELVELFFECQLIIILVRRKTAKRRRIGPQGRHSATAASLLFLCMHAAETGDQLLQPNIRHLGLAT